MKRLVGVFLRLANWGMGVWNWLARPVTIGVRTVVLCQGQVLLVRHTYMPGWLMPGGTAGRGETLEQAARRELWEETGLKIDDLRLLGIYTNLREYKTNHIAVFVGHASSPVLPASQSMEIAEQRFFPLDALPPDVHPGHARRIVEVQQDPERVYSGTW